MGVAFATITIAIIIFVIVIFSSEHRHSRNRNSSHSSVYPYNIGNENSSPRSDYPDNKATIKLWPPREPVPSYARKQIYYRANYQCENPFCRKKVRLDIHHIDMNRNNNQLSNLIALCRECHDGAHSNKYPGPQVKAWMRADYTALLQKQNEQSPFFYTR